MGQNYNSALRVFRILEHTTKLNGDKTALQIWGEVFGISETNLPKKAILVVEMLGILYEEIEMSHEKMRFTSFSSTHYEPVFTNLYKIIDVSNLQASWRQNYQYLTERVLSMLHMFSEVIENEEVPIPEDDIASLSTLLSEFKNEILNSNLPKEVLFFILEQVRIIEKAIKSYPIAGKKVFTEAFIKAASDLAINTEIIEKHKDNPEMLEKLEKLKSLWGQIKTYVENGETVQKLIAGAVILYEIAQRLLP